MARDTLSCVPIYYLFDGRWKFRRGYMVPELIQKDDRHQYRLIVEWFRPLVTGLFFFNPPDYQLGADNDVVFVSGWPPYA